MSPLALEVPVSSNLTSVSILRRLLIWADTALSLHTWSERNDLNIQPPGPKPGALPLSYAQTLVAGDGFEPSILGYEPSVLGL